MTEDQTKPSRPVAVFGAGGHGLTVGAVLAECGHRVFFLDDRLDALNGMSDLDYMLVGGSEKLEDPRFLRRHDLFIGIGDNQKRRYFTELAEKNGAKFQLLIDPDAIVTAREVGPGGMILAMAVVSTNVVVGKSVIIDIGAIVTHDCTIGDYANIAPGARLLGGVRVGEMALIGGGAIVIPKIRIGDRAIVGAGAVVTKDVPDGATVVGNPARITHHTDSEAILPGTGDNIVKIVTGL